MCHKNLLAWWLFSLVPAPCELWFLYFPRLSQPGFWMYGVLSHLWLWDAVDSGWLQPRNIVRHLTLVLKANSWLFACSRGGPGQIQSRYLEVLQSSHNLSAHARSGRMWLHHVLVSNKEHPSFPSDREIPNFSGAVDYLKIYISVPEGCSSLPARETCHEARGSYCCHHGSASDGTQASRIWESVLQGCLFWSMP